MPEDQYTTVLDKHTKNLEGNIFGALRVIGFSRYKPLRNGKRSACWLCQCVCGITKEVRANNLVSGRTQSCGCVKAEKTRKRNTTHGGCHTPEYTIWCAMIQRCSYHKNESFKNYGARGIHICEAWRSSFAAFLTDMGKRPSHQHSIERLDNEKGYSPDNCIWATAETQQRNKRTNHLVTYNGETLCLVEWEQRTGLARGRIADRLAHGWSIEKALFTPPRHWN